MAGVPHLQELNDKYSAKGFEILAVSKEEEGLIQTKMIDGKKATFGVVKADIGALYSTRGIPHCWVLDVEGKLLFEGHPNSVTNEKVEEWVKDLSPGKIEKELAKELKGSVAAYNKGEFGKALTEAEEVAAAATDELVKTDAQYVKDLLQKRIDSTNNKIKKAEESNNLLLKAKALTEGSEAFKGSPQGDTWAGDLKELEKSDAYKDTVKASEELEKLRPKLEDMKASSAKKALEKIAKKYPETTAGKEAAELAKRYEE